MKAFLLFTNTDFGHQFDEQSAGYKLIAKVADKELVFNEGYVLATLGAGASERTSGSLIPQYFTTYRYHYVIDARTYSTVIAINQGFYIAEQERGTSQPNSPLLP